MAAKVGIAKNKLCTVDEARDWSGAKRDTTPISPYCIMLEKPLYKRILKNDTLDL
jgi:hypothetical protein